MGRKLESFESNIVDFGAFREKRRLVAGTALVSLPVFYINETRCTEPALRSFPFLDFLSINSVADFETALKVKTPVLVIVDAFLSWADPLEMIRRVGELPDCKVVLVYRPEEEKKNQEIFKQAFPLGLFDTVATPVTRDELLERLDVLFRLNLRTS